MYVRAARVVRFLFLAHLPAWCRGKGGRLPSCSGRCTPESPAGSLWWSGGVCGDRRVCVRMRVCEGVSWVCKYGLERSSVVVGFGLCMYACVHISNHHHKRIPEPGVSTSPSQTNEMIATDQTNQKQQGPTGPHPRHPGVGGGEGDEVRLRQPHRLAALPPELLQACFFCGVMGGLLMGKGGVE